jgi:heterogeneous nuclear ribonucleoprotein F/H
MQRPHSGLDIEDDGIMGDDPQPSSGEAASVASLWAQQSSTSPPIQPMYSEDLSSHGTSVGGMAMAGRGGGPNRGGLHAPPAKRTGGGIQVGEHTGFLRMRGLPFIACKEDILNFFEG